jgi:hypothetical protein
MASVPDGTHTRQGQQDISVAHTPQPPPDARHAAVNGTRLTVAATPTLDDLKALAKERGCRIDKMLVLSTSTDPFYADLPARRAQAEWFARLWAEFSFAAGTHLRRVHYVLVSQKIPILLPDSEKLNRKDQPYANTEECWGYLVQYSAYARHLGLVPADAFVDRRNPDPHLFLKYEPRFPPSCAMEAFPDWGWPFVRKDLTAYLHFPVPGPLVSGYGYDQTDQPYHVEVWVEKSTMNDELIPTCRALGVNLVTSAGYQSITSAVNLLKRARRADKPVRLFWVSDFDPAGNTMPPAVARQVEFYRQRYAPGTDVKITPLALTRDQVIEYDLPRIPIKDSDARKGCFEERHGAGAVELDALEALHPGTLARIVADAVKPYRDPTLGERLPETGREAQDQAEEEWEEATEALREQLEEIEEEAGKICKRYEARLAKIDKELQRKLQPLKARLDECRLAYIEAAEGFNPDLPDRPEGETDPPDEGGWLYDSGREYLDQLAAYKRHRGTTGGEE